ncbi:hypothetical protein ATE62_12995 [Sphingopyxis sp. HIX]|uniref:YwqG family protein n=2 Tax=unclassified Sphingopyxis TaxID=2614943 RepID=UPI0007367E39|nr:YwqG family protein [Sphingopyxis sp. HIX]KTE37619.1 hypothetical protein ATE62_12995 [Sphingopyxis sp. HIX]
MTAQLFGLFCAAIVVALVLAGPVRRWLAERKRQRAWQTETAEWKAGYDARNPPGPPLTEAEIAAIKDWFPAHALPAAELRPDPAAPVRPDGCRLGGPVWLAEGQEWPVDGDGRPFDFVAQVDFEHLPALDGFPATGVLQFFTQREDIMGVDFDHPDRSVIRLIWHPNGLPAGGLVPPPPQDEPTGPLTDATRDTGITLVASPAMHQPSFNDFRVEGLIDGLGNRPNFKVIDDWLYDPAHEEPMVHHVGGHPAFTQFDFRRPRHLDDYDRTLLRLTSDDHIFWGDVGEAVFLIRAADLAARDFSRVAFSWDCH